MAEQYIFSIQGLTKMYNKREVLKNIWLSFYPGAKIGVIGGNGAGKSSLLRVMAGVDKDFIGTARLTPGFTVGYVPQEPRLDETIDVRGNIEQAVAPIRRPAAPPGGTRQQDGRGLPRGVRQDLRRDGPRQRRHRRRQRLGTRPHARDRDGRHAPAPGRGDARRRSPAASAAASPCARSCSRSPTCCCSTSRRTTSTPSRWRGSSGTCRSTPAPSSR